MRSVKRGSATSASEVVNVSSRGFWLFFGPLERELYLSFKDFPWFADATIRQLSNVEVERGRIVRWPDLDVDLDVERIEHPARFPLVSRSSLGSRRARTRARRPREHARP